MQKNHFIISALVVLVASLLLSALFGDAISARLSQLPFIKRFQVLNPTAPIVINNREMVRVSDANDAVETTNSVRNKLSSLVYLDADDRPVLVGNLLNWTADGYFVGINSAFQTPNKQYKVVTGDGKILDIENRITDLATGLVLIDTNAQSLPTIDSIDDSSLRPSQKLLLLANSLGAGKVTVKQSHISKLSHDVAGQVFESDKIVRGVNLESVDGLILGQAVVTLDGKLAGIWDGNSILSSDVIRTFTNSFFSDGRAIRRSAFGFKYRHITRTEAELSQVAPGAQIVSVTSGQASQLAGLLPRDTISSVNGQPVTDDVLLEALIETIKPGEPTEFEIVRGENKQKLTVIPAVLK